MSTGGNRYLELLRSNRNYRRIWMGDVASLLGDWLNTIAIYTLVQRLTGSPLALGLVFVTKMLPFALASPVGGWLADRYDRRRLMIGADLVRAVIVLGFLLVREGGDLPLLYALTASQLMVGAVFIPARSASIPNITSGRELVVANALAAATWSTLLAVGAAVGGVVNAWLGSDAVFLINSVSYCVSAVFIFGTKIPQRTEARAGHALRAVWGEIGAGWRHLLERPAIRRMALVKPAWAAGGGALVYMLALLGEEMMPAAPAVGIGLLYSARGLGTGIGPLLAARFLADERRWPTMFGLGIAASGVAYLGVAYLGVGSAGWAWAAAVLVVAAHTPSGANWTMSTVALQRRTEDAFRGRVFSSEWLLLTLTDTVAILAAAMLLEYGGLGLRAGIAIFAAVEVAIGLLWLVTIVPAEARDDPARPAAPAKDVPGDPTGSTVDPR